MSADAKNPEMLEMLERRVVRERRARKEAETILEQKSRELYQANRALGEAKQSLKCQVDELRIERDRVLSLSRIDPLTKLANRTAFLQALDKDLKRRRKPDHFLKLLLIDLRQFKQINNLVGQYGGDTVLKTVARRLAAVAEEYNGTAARFGGTEFALSLELKAGQAICHAERIRTLLQEPMTVIGRRIKLKVAIGAAGTNIVDPTLEALGSSADYALLKCRSAKSGGVCVFDKELQAEISRRIDLEARLREAIKKNEIEPWFQPIINSGDPEHISFEVLARWINTDEHISPDVFIPIAEAAGLRRKLDRFLLDRACEIARPWVTAGWLKDISVNVSPDDLIMPGFVDDLRSILAHHDFPSECLVVEITESVFINDMDTARDRLLELKALGVKVALDDFGTGYSNLRSLVGLPLSKIKLDRSLISELNVDDRIAMLISTITQWARAINIGIVAEGVETESQLTVLKALGCSSLQGYYFGKAQPAGDIILAYGLKEDAIITAMVH